MKGILIVDHGSVRAEANDMLRCMSSLLQTMAGPDVVVRYAHMELAQPDIAREMLERVRAHVQGVQVSAPFGKVELALDVFRDTLAPAVKSA